MNVSQQTMGQLEMPFINITIQNELGFCEIEDKLVSDETIHNYVAMCARALEGITFSKQTVYDGFKSWVEAYEQGDL